VIFRHGARPGRQSVVGESLQNGPRRRSPQTSRSPAKIRIPARAGRRTFSGRKRHR
jgi:hypothetical protein